MKSLHNLSMIKNHNWFRQSVSEKSYYNCDSIIIWTKCLVMNLRLITIGRKMHTRSTSHTKWFILFYNKSPCGITLWLIQTFVKLPCGKTILWPCEWIVQTLGESVMVTKNDCFESNVWWDKMIINFELIYHASQLNFFLIINMSLIFWY